MYGELADQQLAAMVAAVCGKTGQGQAVVDKFAVQGGKYGAHAASITKGRHDIKEKCWILVIFNQALNFGREGPSHEAPGHEVQGAPAPRRNCSRGAAI